MSLVLVFSLLLLLLGAERHGLLHGGGQLAAPGLGQEEGEDADDDGGAAHDHEGEEVCHGVQVRDGGGQQRAQAGQRGAHACTARGHVSHVTTRVTCIVVTTQHILQLTALP